MQRRLVQILKSKLPTHTFGYVCSYLFEHPGKLFRSNLIHLLAHDLGYKDQDAISQLSAFIEIHHTYSLIHDDLPAMDNDDMRRGIASTHKKFDEASAILAGDALIIASFACLSDLPGQSLPHILKICSWATGPKGLISGQYFDLKKEPKSFDELLRIHELKTSRLFQICTLGVLILNEPTPSLKKFQDFMRLGQLIGLIFQMIDDLGDQDDQDAEFNNLAKLDLVRFDTSLKKYLEKFCLLCDRYQLISLKERINEYAKSQSVTA